MRHQSHDSFETENHLFLALAKLEIWEHKNLYSHVNNVQYVVRLVLPKLHQSKTLTHPSSSSDSLSEAVFAILG